MCTCAAPEPLAHVHATGGWVSMTGIACTVAVGTIDAVAAVAVGKYVAC